MITTQDEEQSRFPHKNINNTFITTIIISFTNTVVSFIKIYNIQQLMQMFEDYRIHVIEIIL